jgi:hypothetical protein
MKEQLVEMRRIYKVLKEIVPVNDIVIKNIGKKEYPAAEG